MKVHLINSALRKVYHHNLSRSIVVYAIDEGSNSETIRRGCKKG